jgi:sec-independent protein translocase protein TatA
MGSLSIWHWIIIIGVVALLFGGKGKISGLMGDLAKGIKAFKTGMKEEETTAATAPPQVAPPAASASPAPAADRTARDHS